jgi:hypothetical protein
MFVDTPRIRNSATERRAPAHRRRKIPAAAGQLHQHRIEMRRHLGTDLGAAIELDPGAAGRPVDGDAAGVRAEPVDRILGGDAALQRRATRNNRFLAQR